jgi:hypothetical protein
MSQSRMVPLACRSQRSSSRVGGSTTTRCGRIRVLAISRRTNSQLGKQKTQHLVCNGPGRCGIWGLRALARCATCPHRAHAANGRHLKLAVVRRIWAGQIGAARLVARHLKLGHSPQALIATLARAGVRTAFRRSAPACGRRVVLYLSIRHTLPRGPDGPLVRTPSPPLTYASTDGGYCGRHSISR